MAEHTPGPWLRAGRTIYALIGKGKRQVNRFSFQVQGGGLSGAPIEELEAVAVLAQAAPDLLAACKIALAAFGSERLADCNLTDEEAERLDAILHLTHAIARAEGKVT